MAELLFLKELLLLRTTVSQASVATEFASGLCVYLIANCKSQQTYIFSVGNVFPSFPSHCYLAPARARNKLLLGASPVAEEQGRARRPSSTPTTWWARRWRRGSR